MQINQTECQTDKIKTDAILRGVRVIDYNLAIQEARNDLEQFRLLCKKHGLKDMKGLAEMNNRLEVMEMQVRDWIMQAGFDHPHRNYAVTILVEETK